MKKVITLVLLIGFSFCRMPYAWAGYPSPILFIVNETKEEIKVVMQFSDNIEFSPSVYAVPPYIVHWFTSADFRVDLNRVWPERFATEYKLKERRVVSGSLKSGKRGGLYDYHNHQNGARLFDELLSVEQFKILYKEFTVSDENGTVLLTLETLNQENFRRMVGGLQVSCN